MIQAADLVLPVAIRVFPFLKTVAALVSDKQTAQWAFAAQQERIYRPLLSVGSGVPAAAMFYEHLADTDDAALRRLLIVFFIWYEKTSI